MKNKQGPFATQKKKNTVTAIPISLAPAVPRGYVDNTLYPGLLTRAAADADLVCDLLTWFPVSTTTDPSNQDNHLDDTGDFQDGYLGTQVRIVAGPYETTIPQIWLTQGIHNFRYKVTRNTPGGGVNVSGSETLTFVVDRIAPYQTAGISPRPLLMPAGHTGPLDAEYFAANNNQANLRIQDYDEYDAQPGDKWELLEGANGAVVATGDVFPNQVVTLTLEQAEQWEGARSIYHRLRDAAGNISTTSLGLPVTIAIRPAPVLKSPGVKYALSLAGTGDRLIDRADAAAVSGLVLIVPFYDADRVRDNIFIRLTTNQGTRQVGPLPLGSTAFPGDFPVDFPTLKFLYGPTAFGPIAMTAGYGVERGGVFHWLPAADEVIVELDLSLVGPENPNEPDLPNPNLSRPVLTGPVSNLTNQLDPLDASMDAPVAVTLWTALPGPGARAFTLHLYYANELVDSVPVDHQNLPPNGIVTMNLPWAFISKHGNGNNIPLHYEVATTGTGNRNFSLTQGIDVSANVITFNQPTITGAVDSNGTTIIACSAVMDYAQNGGYVEVNVPAHSLFTVGMVIVVSWQAFSDDAGMVPIAAASGTFSHTALTLPEVVNGFKLRVQPGNTYIKPIYDFMTGTGSVRIKYSVPLQGPNPIDSVETHALVRTVLSGSTPVYCDATPWP